jgi:hypothetical protein
MLFDVFKRKPKAKWKLAYEGGSWPWKISFLETSYYSDGRWYLVESFKDKQEALAKLEEIKDSPYYYD